MLEVENENEKSLEESSKNKESEEFLEDDDDESFENEELEEFLEDDDNESFEDEESKESLKDNNDKFFEDEELSLDKEIDNNKGGEIEKESSEDEEKFGNIIDKALDINKMLPYNNNNEFVPYFENFTTALLFCWIQKYNISTKAYEDLVEIINSPNFISSHVIKNIRRFHKWRQHLPILPISARFISISSKKTLLTSKDSKISYQLSINNIIWHVLNNSSLMKHMYFSPSIDFEIKSEYWHSTLWEESSFFDKEKITISRG